MHLLVLTPRLLTLALALGVVGCTSSRPHDTVPAADAPSAVQFKPQPQESYLNVAPPGYLAVPEAPPTDQLADMQPPAPSNAHVWTQGAWGWNGQRYDWNHGQWVVPPAGYGVWVAPNYERRAQGTYYAPGYWRHDAEHGGRQDIGDYRKSDHGDYHSNSYYDRGDLSGSNNPNNHR